MGPCREPRWWALIVVGLLLICGPFPLVPMFENVSLCFFVSFEHVFFVISTCRSTNEQSPKLIEFVSYKS